MGHFDQAARYATKADRDAVIGRLMRDEGVAPRWREWDDTRTASLPGAPDRTADVVAILDDPPRQPILLVFEYQSEHDADKLDSTLEEVGILRNRVRWGDDNKGRYRVVMALIYLQGCCPVELIDMTLPSGRGTLFAPLIWNVGDDEAGATLDAVAAGEVSWGMLFWVPLMAGAEDPATIGRWREMVSQTIPNRRDQGDLGRIAVVFADLVGRRAAWVRGLEGFNMTESQVVNEWIAEARTEGELEGLRGALLRLLRRRFPVPIPPDVSRMIGDQDSFDVLNDWFDAATEAKSFQEFTNVLAR